jgi:putative DNA primase/helicase
VINDLRIIARALGGRVIGCQVLAPGPGHSARDRSLSVRLSPTAPEGFLAFSHAGDNFVSCRDHVKRALSLPTGPSVPPTRTPQSNRPNDERAGEYVAQLISELQRVRGSPAEDYLRDARGIDPDLLADVFERTDAIGWHPHVKFNEPGHELHGQRLGCIIAKMADAVTAKPTGAISRTYIHKGSKVVKAKTLGSPAGIVRLSPDEDVLEGLHIAEGIESALYAMALGFRPMWATGSTAIMAKLPSLPASRR